VYELPDGTYGASGIPDPKRLLDGNTLFILDPNIPSTRLPNVW
jgi:hypothetical protein